MIMKLLKKILNKCARFIALISDTRITDDHSKDKIPKRSGHVWLDGDGINNLSSRRFKK